MAKTPRTAAAAPKSANGAATAPNKPFKFKADNVLKKKIRPVSSVTPPLSATPSPAHSSRRSLLGPPGDGNGSKRNSLISLTGSIRSMRPSRKDRAGGTPAPIQEEQDKLIAGDKYQASPIKTKRPELPATMAPLQTPTPPSPVPSHRSARKPPTPAKEGYMNSSYHKPGTNSPLDEYNPLKHGVFDDDAPAPSTRSPSRKSSHSNISSTPASATSSVSSAWLTPTSVASSQKVPWKDTYIAPENKREADAMAKIFKNSPGPPVPGKSPKRNLNKIQNLSLNTDGMA